MSPREGKGATPGSRRRVCLCVPRMSGEEKKKKKKKRIGSLSTVVELPVCRIDVPAERANEGASTSALARSREWEIRRYKTDLVDWYQPVQRPDAATALVARVRERRSRCSACGTHNLTGAHTDAKRAYTHTVYLCDTDQRIAGHPSGGDSVQDFRERVESEFVRRAYPKGDFKLTRRRGTVLLRRERKDGELRLDSICLGEHDIYPRIRA